VKAEWRSAPDFAEVAETLGCNTVDIMAVLPDQVVLYTPSPDVPDPVIYAAFLARDADGILRATGKRVYMTTSVFTAGIDAHMRRALGDPQ
jgi:hypothetical protein